MFEQMGGAVLITELIISGAAAPAKSLVRTLHVLVLVTGLEWYFY